MKMMPTRHGAQAPVSNEEMQVINKLQGSDVSSSDMSPRDIALADRLVARGIVDRTVTTKKTIYAMTKGGSQ